MNRPKPGMDAPLLASNLARNHTLNASHDSRSFFASIAWDKGSAPRFLVAAFNRSPTTSVTKSSAQSICWEAMVAWAGRCAPGLGQPLAFCGARGGVRYFCSETSASLARR